MGKDARIKSARKDEDNAVWARKGKWATITKNQHHPLCGRRGGGRKWIKINTNTLYPIIRVIYKSKVNLKLYLP